VTLDIHNVVINCEHPQRLAEFWAQALEMEVLEDHGSFVQLGRPGSPVGLGLQRVPEPRAGKNRVHIDLHGESREAATRRLVELGATIQGEQRPPGLDLAWIVLTDPEGNEFCIGGHIA
jgi:catechol 2,3-dioxygenase-like lactoylglutathione lyase family enzyme